MAVAQFIAVDPVLSARLALIVNNVADAGLLKAEAPGVQLACSILDQVWGDAQTSRPSSRHLFGTPRKRHFAAFLPAIHRAAYMPQRPCWSVRVPAATYNATYMAIRCRLPVHLPLSHNRDDRTSRATMASATPTARPWIVCTSPCDCTPLSCRPSWPWTCRYGLADGCNRALAVSALFEGCLAWWHADTLCAHIENKPWVAVQYGGGRIMWNTPSASDLAPETPVRLHDLRTMVALHHLRATLIDAPWT